MRKERRLFGEPQAPLRAELDWRRMQTAQVSYTLSSRISDSRSYFGILSSLILSRIFLPRTRRIFCLYFHCLFFSPIIMNQR